MALVSYVFYFRDIWAGKTKPHAFTWLIWTSLTAIGFAAQVADNGGPGAWVTGFTAAVSIVIFVVSLFRGERNIIRSDWICLAGAGLAAGLWAVTDDALLAVILVSIIDALGFAPTFRKSFRRPYEETLIAYVLSALKFVLALFALDNFTAVTALYPASLVLMNGAFALMLVIRRRQVTSDESTARSDHGYRTKQEPTD
jgi:hypothetical protein